MKIREMKDLLNATVLYGDDFLDTEVLSGFCCDMMSDVLARAGDEPVLITGLCNPQVIRTAEMMDIACIIFIRGKHPDDNMMRLATERQLPILCTRYRAFTTCGILYKNGLRGGEHIA